MTSLYTQVLSLLPSNFDRFREVSASSLAKELLAIAYAMPQTPNVQQIQVRLDHVNHTTLL